MRVHPLNPPDRAEQRDSLHFIGSLFKKERMLTQIENDYFSAWATMRLKILEKTILLIEIMVLMASMACFEVSKMNDLTSRLAEFFLLGTMSLSALNIPMFVLHVFCERDFLISKNIYSPMTLVRDTPLLRQAVYNILLCCVTPNFFFNDPRFTLTIRQPSVSADYSIGLNGFLTIAVICRFTYFLMLVKNFTTYNSNSSNRICKMVGFKSGVPFLVRIALKHHSLPSILFLSSYLIFFTAYIFRITEWDNPLHDFTNLFNSGWFVMIVDSTVAYGDYLLFGDVSRFLGIPLIFIGLLNTNLIIYVLMTLMGLEGAEKAAFSDLETRKKIDRLNNLRACLLTQLIRVAILRKKPRNLFSPITWRVHVTRLAQLCRNYKELNLQVNNPVVNLDEGVLCELGIFEQTIVANIAKLEDVRRIGETVELALESPDGQDVLRRVNTQTKGEFI